MRQILLILFILFGTVQSWSQKIEFGDVTLEDLKQQSDPIFTEADAVLLYKGIELDYGRSLKVHERVKIYTSEGFEYAKWDIPYENVRALEATTFTLDNGAIKKTSVTAENIFVDKVSEDEEIRKITFPNVQEGSIIEIKYTVPFIGFYNLYTQHFIPIKKLRINVNNPDKAALDIQENPFVSLPIQKIETDYNYLFTGTDIPALRREEFVTNVNNHRGQLIIELFGQTRYRKYTWTYLAVYLNKLEWFGGQLKRGQYFYKKDIEEVLGGETDPLKKAQLIDAYVKRVMTWDKTYSRGSESIRKVYVDKEGNSGDINLLMTAMLRSAGLDANPMLIATKSWGWVMYPRLRAFNTVAVAVDIDGEMYLLDASRKDLGFGELPLSYINGNGFIVKEDGSSINYPTRIKKHSRNTLLISADIDTEEFAVRGSVKKQITGYYAWIHRERYGDNREESYKETMDRRALFTLDNLKKTDFENAPKPIKIDYDFTYQDYIEQIDDRLYFQPLLHCDLEENRYNEIDRLYPVDLEHPYIQTFIINFSIPEGYKVESLPESKKVVMEDGMGELTFKSSQQNEKVQISLTIRINESLMPPEYYEGLKGLYNEYANVSKSKIVLIKE